jgi:multiple sugar transport system permease protein
MTRRGSARRTLRLVGIYLASLLVLVWALAPIFWIVVSSISTRMELLSRPFKHWIPHDPTLQNFIDIVTVGERYRAGGVLPTSALLLAGLRNTLIVALSTAFLTSVLSTVAGYAFARLRFRMRGTAFLFIMLMMPLPIWATIVSLYYLIAHMGLVDTNIGMIAIFLAISLPLAVWLMSTFIREIPGELEEASVIDGASRQQMFLLVLTPLALPGITSVFLVTFLTTWNAFLLPLIFTNTTKSQSITVVLSLFVGQYEVAWEQMAAATVLVIVPPILLALFFQRFLVRGLTTGAVKG